MINWNTVNTAGLAGSLFGIIQIFCVVAMSLLTDNIAHQLMIIPVVSGVAFAGADWLSQK